jgi:uncharacterized Zn finger protein
MNAETRPERRFTDGPPLDENQETAVPALLTQAVEDLAVYEPVQTAIADLLGTEDQQVVEAYLLSWKQALRHQLEATALSAVDNFVTGFHQFQADLELEGQVNSTPESGNSGSEPPLVP